MWRFPTRRFLAIKEAFVKALTSNGVVDKNEINRICAELGLSPDSAVDTSLRKRSITPARTSKPSTSTP